MKPRIQHTKNEPHTFTTGLTLVETVLGVTLSTILLLIVGDVTLGTLKHYQTFVDHTRCQYSMSVVEQSIQRDLGQHAVLIAPASEERSSALTLEIGAVGERTSVQYHYEDGQLFRTFSGVASLVTPSHVNIQSVVFEQTPGTHGSLLHATLQAQCSDHQSSIDAREWYWYVPLVLPS